MIVPRFWAEAKIKSRVKDRQVTVRRFGWSDIDQDAAQAHANSRAEQAVQQILQGETVHRRDHKVPYNGGEGLPIREEIVEQIGTTIITRNAYGARCLNTENVLFADIDFADTFPMGCLVGALIFLSLIVNGLLRSQFVLLITGLIAVSYLIVLLCRRVYWSKVGGDEGLARARIRRFINSHPDWNVRVYRTFAGLRVMALHRTFAANDPEVRACFRSWKVDKIYYRMCLNQNCFRARLSPKPWRIGIHRHLRPQPGTWPISPERLPDRVAWVNEYEQVSVNFKTCQFLEDIGSQTVDEQARRAREIHDEACRVHSDLPLA